MHLPQCLFSDGRIESTRIRPPPRSAVLVHLQLTSPAPRSFGLRRRRLETIAFEPFSDKTLLGFSVSVAPRCERKFSPSVPFLFRLHGGSNYSSLFLGPVLYQSARVGFVMWPFMFGPVEVLMPTPQKR